MLLFFHISNFQSTSFCFLPTVSFEYYFNFNIHCDAVEDCFCVEHRLSYTEVLCFSLFVNRNLILEPATGLNCSIRNEKYMSHGRQVKLLMKAVSFKQREGDDHQSLKIRPHFLQHGQVKGIHGTVLLLFNSILFFFPISLFFWKKKDNRYVKDFCSQKVAHCCLGQYVAGSSAGM